MEHPKIIPARSEDKCYGGEVWACYVLLLDFLKFSQELLDNLTAIQEFFWKPTFIRFFIQNRTLLGYDSYIPNISKGVCARLAVML